MSPPAEDRRSWVVPHRATGAEALDIAPRGRWDRSGPSVKEVSTARTALAGFVTSRLGSGIETVFDEQQLNPRADHEIEEVFRRRT